VFQTATISELRKDIATYVQSLEEGPLVILSHSHPAAIMVEPEMFEGLLEKVELLEDLLDGKRLLEDYLSEPGSARDAEEVFQRLGHS